MNNNNFSTWLSKKHFKHLTIFSNYDGQSYVLLYGDKLETKFHTIKDRSQVWIRKNSVQFSDNVMQLIESTRHAIILME